MAAEILQRTELTDPATQTPVLTVTAANIPRLPFYTDLIPQLLEQLPPTPYSIVFFAAGGENRPAWNEFLRMYKGISRDVRKRIARLYIVHESWAVRVLLELLSGVVSPKFKRKLVHVSSLSQLSSVMDISKLNIAVRVYLHDRKLHQVIPATKPVFGLPFTPGKLPRVVIETCDYIERNQEVGIFRVSPRKELVDILASAYDRDQILALDDYQVHAVASTLKLYLRSLPSPVMSSNLVPSNDLLWNRLILMLQRLDPIQTRMDAKNLAICLAPCISQKDNPREMGPLVQSLTQLIESIQAMPPPLPDRGRPTLSSKRSTSLPPLSRGLQSVSPQRAASDDSSNAKAAFMKKGVVHELRALYESRNDGY